MQDFSSGSTGEGPWPKRILAMERDLQFIYFLLGSAVYRGQRPNLYERLQQYGVQAVALEDELRQIDPNRKEDLVAFETRLTAWKGEIYEFLESIM